MCVYVFGLDFLYNKDNYILPMYKVIFAKTVFIICLPYISTLKYIGVLHFYNVHVPFILGDFYKSYKLSISLSPPKFNTSLIHFSLFVSLLCFKILKL